MSIELDVGTGGKIIRTRQTSDGAVSGEHTQVVEAPPSDYFTEILRGNISGQAFMMATGERESISTTAAGEDVWRGNQLASAPTSHVRVPTPADAGEQMSIKSESDADNGATATGILTVRLHYLDATGAEQTEDVTLNGTTLVNTVATDIRFVQELHALTVGSGGVAAGHIFIHKTGTAGLVYSMIAAGGNYSLVPHRMVPLAKTLYLMGWHATEAKNKRCAFRIRSTDHGGTLLPGVFVFKDVAYLAASASGRLVVSAKVPALSIVKVTGWADVAGAEGSAEWHGVLIDD